jgi:hypothetical protein
MHATVSRPSLSATSMTLIRGPERQAMIAAAAVGSSDDPVAAITWLRARAICCRLTDLPLAADPDARDRFTGYDKQSQRQLDGQRELRPLLVSCWPTADLDGEQRAAAHAELLKLAIDDPEAMRLAAKIGAGWMRCPQRARLLRRSQCSPEKR